jgi:hypothetical protein
MILMNFVSSKSEEQIDTLTYYLYSSLVVWILGFLPHFRPDYSFVSVV